MLAKEFVKRLSTEIFDFLRDKLGLSPEQLAAIEQIRASCHGILVACDKFQS